MGEGRLGGISTTLAARECLLLRGYDTAAVVVLGDRLGNCAALRAHLGPHVPVLALPECRPPPAGAQAGCARACAWTCWHAMSNPAAMHVHCKERCFQVPVLPSRAGRVDDALAAWLAAVAEPMQELRELLHEKHEARGAYLLPFSLMFSDLLAALSAQRRTLHGAPKREGICCMACHERRQAYVQQ